MLNFFNTLPPAPPFTIHISNLLNMFCEYFYPILLYDVEFVMELLKYKHE